MGTGQLFFFGGTLGMGVCPRSLFPFGTFGIGVFPAVTFLPVPVLSIPVTLLPLTVSPPSRVCGHKPRKENPADEDSDTSEHVQDGRCSCTAIPLTRWVRAAS
jgi:hypothetical protein